jgi:hypothetical protein
MDVWFDSGTSWAGVVEARPGLAFPADLYLEVPAGAAHPSCMRPHGPLSPTFRDFT